MYKLMIVDDEPAEIRFLRWLITNYKLPFTVCGEAGSGEEAVALTENCQPDFVIMDINMPIMDGLEAARRIKTKYPGTKIYILTAHGEFAYAHQSIKIGVEDYLLKPMNPEAMAEVLMKGVKRAARERLNQRRQARMNVLAKKAGEDGLDRLVLELAGLRPGKTNQMLRGRLSPLAGVQWVFAGYILRGDVVIAEEYQLNSLTRKIRQLSAVKHVSMLPGGQVIVWGREPLTEAMVALNGLIADWSRQAPAGVAGCVLPIDGVAGIETVLRLVLREAEAARFWEEAQIRCADTVKARYQIYNNIVLDIKGLSERMVSLLFSPGETTAATVAGELLDQLKSFGASRELVLQTLTDLFAAIAHELAGLTEEAQPATMRTKLQEETGQAETVSQIRLVVANLVDSLAASVRGSSDNDAERAVKWAVQFIRHNYQQDLNLEVVASKLYLSPCYFSRIFKKYTGQGFSSFLNSYRLQKAKSLLTMGKYTVAEVAHRIGIHDASYFCSVFKKYHKATPSQFISGNTRQKI
ncbi:MAG: response regulator [Negativicutes bacterium]|nr:response regulator [Negativicutes bacterium]MDR3591209.1 response regulator [Negativicutes bacterium]